MVVSNSDEPVILDTEHLSRELNETFPEILFAFLFGSSKDGIIKTGSDIDLAVYFEKGVSQTELIPRIIELSESLIQGPACDLTILNTAGPLVAHEALRGTELFIRAGALEIYASFYSLTCRLYEDQSWWRKKQLEYRGYEVQWDN
jgi:predicted nucleotidyltransferase